MPLSNVLQQADWKTEKHVPVIECPDTVTTGEFFEVTATLGKAVAHPNTTEHHIRWISLYFLPEGAKAPYQVGHCDFTAHGEAVAGPNEGGVYTNHSVKLAMKTDKPGKLLAAAYCNIHGVWESEKPVAIG